MPTTRPRHAVTETPDVSAALQAAARKWPEDRNRPGRLLRRLIREGFHSIEPDTIDARSDRLAVLRRVSGAYTGMYAPDYLERLRAEWPE